MDESTQLWCHVLFTVPFWSGLLIEVLDRAVEVEKLQLNSRDHFAHPIRTFSSKPDEDLEVRMYTANYPVQRCPLHGLTGLAKRTTQQQDSKVRTQDHQSQQN